MGSLRHDIDTCTVYLGQHLFKLPDVEGLGKGRGGGFK